MFDPFGSMQNLMGTFQQFMSNPMQFLASKRLNIPQNLMQNPQGAVQYMLNNGQMTQQQYNDLRGMAQQIQNNPQFMSMLH